MSENTVTPAKAGVQYLYFFWITRFARPAGVQR
jgi:hypothetical protein